MEHTHNKKVRRAHDDGLQHAYNDGLKCAYDTPAAFDRAIKKAVRLSGGNLGEGYRQALRDRFLCRVFADRNETFVLKGGCSLLARIPNARATKDLDFATNTKCSAQNALEEMKKITAIDLGDWCRFILSKYEESMDENGYSRLLKLRFITFVGAEEKDPVLIDLSLDCATTMPPERITPANRIKIAGVQAYDYLVYPLADQLADKLCAIMELQQNGYPSSRMKDLVDVVTYATHETFHRDELWRAVKSECMKRDMSMPKCFAAPDAWKARFAKFANGKLPADQANFDAASDIASRFFNAALMASDRDMTWNPKVIAWEDNA